MQCNQENMGIVIDALRSGNYKQTKGTLEEVNMGTGEVVGNCCLGVATREAQKHGVQLEERTSYGRVHFRGPSSMAWENAVLPIDVRLWLGVDSLNPIVTVKTEDGNFDNALSELNDGESSNNKQYSLTEIADILEYNYMK